jgi:gingipain R
MKTKLTIAFLVCASILTFAQTQKIVSTEKNNFTIQNTSEKYVSSKKTVENISYEDFSKTTKVVTLEKNAPALPFYSESVEISNSGKVSFEISYDSYEEFSNINILPSKGSLKRNVNPDNIPYVFGKEYSQNTFYPGNLAAVSAPFIFRSTRGATVSFYPYQYNPVTKTLRVYKNISAKIITSTEETGLNELKTRSNETSSDFQEMYKNLYINAAVTNPVVDKGDMLIITPASYVTTIQPFVNWKIEKGIKTTVATLTQTGNTATTIKSYIQNFYTANPDLAYVVLVGDHENLPSYTYGLTGANEQLWSDSFYGQLEGTDLFPEVMVGRFSGSTTNVQTMVARVIEYETNPLAGDWMTKAIGIASNEGAGAGDEGQADYVHLRAIATKLINFGYSTVHEFYQGSQGGNDAAGEPTPALISNAINQGTGLLNYTGHGDIDLMVTGNYTNANVNTLTNNGKYPFVISVACNNGTFVNQTSLCEAFTRLNYNNSPAGAIAACGSSILMAWAEPMQVQDEITELIIRSDNQNIKTTLGSIFNNGLVSMLETYNLNASAQEVMQTWIFFGDPSTEFRSKITTDITATHPAQINQNGGAITVTSNTEGATICISQNNEILVKSEIIGGTANVVIPALTSQNNLSITLTKDNRKPYRGTITVNTLGLSEFENYFVIYPNPASDFITIESSKIIDNANIKLFDLNGRVIINKQNMSLDSKFSLPVSEIASGLYLLEINDGANRKIQKIQIK